MLRRFRPRLECLEDRVNPSPLGNPWPNPGQLTISFVPDGTTLNGGTSVLFETLDAVAPATQWEQVILKGFQTWAAQTNVNIGLVTDDGQPLGTDGAVQGDPRFGDIRIGMQTLPANLVASTSPFSWSGTTWSGDIILNSAYSFGINGSGQYDLFTVATHEAGHSLGIHDNTTDPASIMYASYNGPHSSLDATDIADIQTLYGVRTYDKFNQVSRNNSMSTATVVGNSQLSFQADLTTVGDVEFYQITTPATSGLQSVTFQLQTAGSSLLVPQVTVFNASWQQVGSQAASGPLANNVSFKLSGAQPSTTYYFEVSGATNDVFSTGGYLAGVSDNYASLSLGGITTLFGSLSGTIVDAADHTLALAVAMPSPWGNVTDERFNYLAEGAIKTPGVADYYKLTVPAAPTAGGNYALDALVWQTASGGLAPILHVFDASGHSVAVEILANNRSVYTVQVQGAVPGTSYYLEVTSQTTLGSGDIGSYVVGVKFNVQPVNLAPQLGSDTLATSTSTDTGSLAMNQNGVFFFQLGAANGGASTASIIDMTVTNQAGSTVLTLTNTTGAQPRGEAVYLAAGIYTIHYSVTTPPLSTYHPVTYWLNGEVLSDPMGPYYSNGSSSSSSTTTTTSANTTFSSNNASVSISTPSGSFQAPIPAPGASWNQVFNTAKGTTAVGMTTAANGTVTLTLTTWSGNTITDSITTSGSTTTETMSTSDGISVTILTPVTSPTPTYSGQNTGGTPPYYY